MTAGEHSAKWGLVVTARLLAGACLVGAGPAHAQIDAGSAPRMPPECASCMDPPDGIIRIPCPLECLRVLPRQGGISPEPSCFALAPGKPIVKLDLRPCTDVLDIVGWIHMLTCQPFLVPVSARNRTVTVKTYRMLTLEESQHLAWAALDAVGLGLEADGKALRVVEVKKAANGKRLPAVLFSKFAVDRMTLVASVVGIGRRAVLRAPAGPPLVIREGDRLSGINALVTLVGTDRVVFEMSGEGLAGEPAAARTKVTLHAPVVAPAAPAPNP